MYKYARRAPFLPVLACGHGAHLWGYTAEEKKTFWKDEASWLKLTVKRGLAASPWNGVSAAVWGREAGGRCHSLRSVLPAISVLFDTEMHLMSACVCAVGRSQKGPVQRDSAQKPTNSTQELLQYEGLEVVSDFLTWNTEQYCSKDSWFREVALWVRIWYIFSYIFIFET